MLADVNAHARVLPGCEIDWEVHLDTAIDVIKNLYTVTASELC